MRRVQSREAVLVSSFTEKHVGFKHPHDFGKQEVSGARNPMGH